MHVPNIPTPDSVMIDLLKLIFGSSSIVVVGFTVASSLWSWVDPVKTGTKRARQAMRSVMGVPPLARAIGLIISVAMLPLQLVWLFATYLVGNGLGYMFADRPGWTGSPTWSVFIRTLRWDWVSQVYVAVAIVALAVAYMTSFRNHSDRAHSVVWLLALPLIPIGCITLLGTVLSGLLNVMYMINHEGVSASELVEAKDFFIKCLAITGMIVAYLISSYTITSTPGLIARIWSPRHSYQR